MTITEKTVLVTSDNTEFDPSERDKAVTYDAAYVLRNHLSDVAPGYDWWPEPDDLAKCLREHRDLVLKILHADPTCEKLEADPALLMCLGENEKEILRNWCPLVNKEQD